MLPIEKGNGEAVVKIMVTGSTGQLGTELQKLSASYPAFDYIFLSEDDLSILDFETVRHFFNIQKPHFLVNCAAYTAVDKAESDKEIAYKVNADAVGFLAAICNEFNTRFIHISTDYVFDGTASVPYKTDDKTNPQSVYGASKLEGERLAFYNNPGTILLRTSWVYSEFGNNFVKTMKKLMGERDMLNVVNDQVGSPTYAADLAEVIMEIISSGKFEAGIYHYTNEGVINWFDFAVAIKELIGSTCKINPIPTSQYPTPAKRPAYSALDKSKITLVYNIKLKDWKTSLSTCISLLTK
ncbi:MAG: dTDP-4-dehydrorhamnose reductase [Chitinophagaceae bacterium]